MTDISSPIIEREDVILTIPLVDATGAQLSPDTVTMSVFDGAGAALITDVDVDDFIEGAAEVNVIIDAATNTIAGDKLVDLRRVVLTLTTGSATFTITRRYVIRAEDSLAVMKNSFQTLDDAYINSADIVNIADFLQATDQQKIAALVQAYRTLVTRDYILPPTSRCQETDSIGLNTFTADEFADLDSGFLATIKRAQIVEANDVITGGDPISNARQRGLMLDSIGESKQMFRPGKPIDIGMAAATYAILKPYIAWDVRIVRV